MADYSEADSDLFWESCWTSPGTQKQKNKSKKKKKAKKSKSDTSLTKNDGIQPKKKKKLKEEMKERKEEKKEKKKKKKKKKRVILGLDDGFIFTQGCAAFDSLAQWRSPGQMPATTPAVSNKQSLQQPETDQATSESRPQKTHKSKKKVAFELSPGYDCIQVQSTLTSKVILPSTQSAPTKDLSPLQNQGEGDNETLSQGTETNKCPGQMQDNDSQCTGDDSYSQDLFITQKTFRPMSSSEPSSGENNNGEEIAMTTQEDTESYKHVLPRQKQRAKLTHLLTQQSKERNTPPTKLTQHQKESHTHLQGPQGAAHNKLTRFPQQPKKEDHMKIHSHPAEEPKGSHTPHLMPKKANSYLQKPMELNTCGTEESKESHTAHLKHKKAKPYLEQPMEVNTHPDITKQWRESRIRVFKATRPPCSPCTSKQPTHKFPLRLTTDTSTQTENLFTTELSSYLRFHQQSRAAVSSTELEPLDLSLPQRTRAELGRISLRSTKSSVVEDRDGKPGEQHPSSLPILIDDNEDPSQQLLSSSEVKEKKESGGQHLLSSTPKVRGETTPSPQSEAEPKCTDTTTSSEDNDLVVRSGKLDLIQVRSVQTRLNESFFFKMKGEDVSPRPESPLMKLTQGRRMKSNK